MNKKDAQKWIADNQSEPIDWNNTGQLVQDIWLFLTNDKMPKRATIKREALYHEVGIMIDLVKQFYAKEQVLSFRQWMKDQEYVKSERFPDMWYCAKDGYELKYFTYAQIYDKFRLPETPIS